MIATKSPLKVAQILLSLKMYKNVWKHLVSKLSLLKMVTIWKLSAKLLKKQKLIKLVLLSSLLELKSAMVALQNKVKLPLMVNLLVQTM